MADQNKAGAVAVQWTKPYYGVQHYGSFGANSFWATVTSFGSVATAKVWTPGCEFSPMESAHENAEAARKHAENQLHILTKGCTGVRHD